MKNRIKKVMVTCVAVASIAVRMTGVSESGKATYRITTTGYSPKKTSTTTGNKITFRFLGCSSISTCVASGTMGYYGTV